MSRRRLRGEDGQLTLFVSLAMFGLLILAGFVVDSGFVLAARRRAIDEAHGAARAGAEALAPSAYRTTGAVELNPGTAAAAAQGFLGATGHSGTVSVNGNEVTVNVSFEQPTSLLRIIGIDGVTVSGRGHARSVRGIDSEEGP